MTAAALVGYVLVPLFGVVMFVMPLATRPTVQFGVRVPAAYFGAPVVRRERRGYFWRSAVVAVGATAVLFAVGSGAWWPSRVVLAVEIVADLGCFWWAHRRIAKVKSAEGWFAGQRQTVVTDTSWRTEPARFPVRWLLPAGAVIVATVVVGVLRYPQLPAALVVGQLYVTGLGSGLLALVYRSRPDLDTADPAASLRGYRRALGAFARAALVLFACIDLTLLLSALQQVPSVLVLLPTVLGLMGFFVVVIRVGRERARVTRGGADRDDDRFWKAGLVYVNRDDPAVLVNARFGFGWTVNLGNPTAWLLVGGIVAVPVGLVILKVAL